MSKNRKRKRERSNSVVVPNVIIDIDIKRSSSAKSPLEYLGFCLFDAAASQFRPAGSSPAVTLLGVSFLYTPSYWYSTKLEDYALSSSS
jgi:hypothetical protein